MSTSLSLQVFQNCNFGSLHYIVKGDEPWFLAKDVAMALGYSRASNMVRLLDKRDISKIEPSMFKNVDIVELGDPCSLSEHGSIHKKTSEKLTLINESGLYDAIFNSHKPNAKEFRRWVTSEVLPSIRKTGSYNIDESPIDMSLEGFKQNIENAKRIYQIYKDQLELKRNQEVILNRQDKLESEQSQLKTEVHNLTSKAEASLESVQYYSVASYARAIGYIIKDLEEAKKIGKACVRQSSKMGIPLGNKVPQGGMRVNTYHLKVIKSVFDKLEKEREQDSLPLFDSLEDREFWKIN